MRLLSTSVAFTCNISPKNAKIQNLFSITCHSFLREVQTDEIIKLKIFSKRHIFSCKLIHLSELPLNLLIVRSSFFLFLFISFTVSFYTPSFQKIINSIGGALALEPLIDFSRRDFLRNLNELTKVSLTVISQGTYCISFRIIYFRLYKNYTE